VLSFGALLLPGRTAGLDKRWLRSAGEVSEAKCGLQKCPKKNASLAK